MRTGRAQFFLKRLSYRYMTFTIAAIVLIIAATQQSESYEAGDELRVKPSVPVSSMNF